MLGYIFLLASLVFVITFHEFAHAWTAYLLGDPTAKDKGRLTLNPLAHLDPLGSVMMLLIGIGWGKPVPVNSFYFKNPKRHEAIVAVAGPLANLVLAVLVLIPLKYIGVALTPELNLFLATMFDVSILLFAFNMLPFPPLDGSKFLQLLIPKRLEKSYEFYLANAGLYFLAFLLVDNFILSKYFGFSVLSWIVGWIVVVVKSVIFLGS